MPFRLGDGTGESVPSSSGGDGETTTTSSHDETSDGDDETGEEEEDDSDQEEEERTETSRASSSLRSPPPPHDIEEEDHEVASDETSDAEESGPRGMRSQSTMSTGDGGGATTGSEGDDEDDDDNHTHEDHVVSLQDSPSRESTTGSVSLEDGAKPQSYELPGLILGGSRASSASISHSNNSREDIPASAAAARRSPPKRQVASVNRSAVKKSNLKSSAASPTKQKLKSPPKSPAKKRQYRPTVASDSSSSSGTNSNKQQQQQKKKAVLSPPQPVDMPTTSSHSTFSFSSNTDPSLAAKLASAGVGYTNNNDDKKVSFDEDDEDDDESESYETYETDEPSDEFETDTEGDEQQPNAPLPPQYDILPIEEESEDYETDTTYEREATGEMPIPSSDPPPKDPVAQLLRSSTGSVALGSDHSGLLLPKQANTPEAEEKPEKQRGRRKPFDNIPSLIDADAKGVKAKGRDDEAQPATKESQPLGLSGWEQQQTSALENVPNRNVTTAENASETKKKGGVFSWLFGGKKREEPSKQSPQPTTSTPAQALEEMDTEEPVYIPPEYDDEISQVTDRVFFPKTKSKPPKPTKPKPPPRRPENPDHPDMTPSELEHEVQEEAQRFSIRSFRRKNEYNNDRALEDLDPTSILPATGDSAVQDQPKEKRNTKLALAGLPAISVRNNENVGATRNGSPDQIRTALLDMKSESVDLNLSYNLDTPVPEFAGAPARAILMNEALGSISEDNEQENDKDFLGLARTASLEEEFEEEEIIFEEEEYVEEEVEEDKSRDLEQAREPSLMEEKVQDDESVMSFTKRSILYCVILLFLLAAIGVGIWLILKFVVFDDDDRSFPSGGQMPTPPPGTGSLFGETPPPLPPTESPTTTEETLDNLVSTLSPYLPDNGDSFEDSNSPQSQAVEWMSQDPEVYSYDGERLATRFALATLYYSTNGDEWTNNDLWLSNEDECFWYTSSDLDPCDNGRYVQLRLGDNNLQGIIPGDIALLSNSLAAIDLGGTLVSKIPWTIAELTQLTSLRLRGNQLSGTIPLSMNVMTKLSFLDLRRNKLTGTISGELLGSLTNLGTLDLSENQLNGPFPPAIGGLGATLRWLAVENNGLEGSLPEELGDLSALAYLSLDSNKFSALPDSIASLSALKVLSANNNLFQGPLPESIGSQLTELEALYLSNNQFSGTIPESYGSLTSLTTALNLSSNQLSGALPESLGQITALQSLNLRNNTLDGVVPLSWGALGVLDLLRLDVNNLTGELPPALCDSFNEATSSYYADCRQLACPCCNFCCDDQTGECTCRFANSQPILCIP